MNIKRKVLEREDTHRSQSCKNHSGKRCMTDTPKDRNYVSIRLIPTEYSSSVQRRETLVWGLVAALSSMEGLTR